MLNQDGTAELDAGVMDGATLAYGAVVATRHLAHPVRVARRLLLVDAGGRAAWAYTTPRMARAGWHAGSDVWVEV